MAEQAVRPSSDAVEPGRAGLHWRTVDIVIAAVLGVAFGVVFWAWNLVFGVLAAPLDFFPPLSAILNGVYLMPGVVAGLLVRKAGAATFASTLAAAVSLLGEWAPGQAAPLVVVTDRRPRWSLLAVYGQRYWIEPGFRTDKTAGW